MLFGTLLVFVFLHPAAAQVVDSGPNGFVLKSTATINAAPAKVYDALVKDIGKWWDPEHTYSGKASNMSIDARASGCFCEQLDQQGSIEHMTVVYAAPGKALRMTGALGPLQELGVSGALTFDFAAQDGRTVLTMTYAVGGYRPGGFEQLAPLVHGVLSTQLTRLHAFIETGSPKK